MRLSHLSLTYFRNYARLELNLPPGVIVLYGNNAQGKTSLLEAVYYLATSRALHATSDRQLINWLAKDDPIPHARLVGEAETQQGKKRIELTLLTEKTARGSRLKKEIRINGISRRVMDLLGHMTVVLFLPQDLALVEGSPSLRRRYLNITLCQTDPDYCRAVNQYEKVLSQRNALLRQFQEQGGRGDRSLLTFWDEQLAQHGATVVAGRYRFIRELEREAREIQRDLSGEHETLRLRYQPGFDAAAATDGQMSFDVADMGVSTLPQLPPKEITKRFVAALHACVSRDIARGMTTIGPQRDELRLLVNGHDLGLYGSRGQNRTGVLALKLAELAWMREKTGEWPILLLDEVAAELDHYRRSYLLERIGQAEQVILTTTEPDLLPAETLVDATRWRVTDGTIDTALAS
ncbi:MAG: DNA replication/repair protein RecF [Chloroflexi bacterium]|nr:DNA replication/repair protein RecF [Chloroflexota bacterium]